MSQQIPTTMRAYAKDNEGPTASVQTVDVPSLDDNEVLIKVAYAAQNPTDWKHVEWIAKPGSIIGCDYSGTVVKVGNNLTNSLSVGDRVAGSVHGGLFPNKGAFAEYAKQESDLVYRVPESVSLETAALFGIPFGTAFQGMVHSQNKEFPPANSGKGEWYLIYGASSSVGLVAVSLAKAMGYKVVAVCGPHNFDLVKSYGADEAVDYHDAEKASAEVKRITGGGVSLAFDTISEGGSFAIAIGGFGEKGGRLNCILPPTDEARALRKDVEIEWTLMYTFFGKSFTWLNYVEAEPKDRAFYVELCKRTPELITTHGIKGNPIEHRGGLDAISQGFADMKANKVSGRKLVYKIAA